MKLILGVILLLVANGLFAQTDDHQLVEKAGLNYLEGFYEGDTTKLIEALSPDLYKYGYWKGRNGEFSGEQMTYLAAMDFAKSVLEKKSFAKQDSPKVVEVLDIQEFVAAMKITAWWGIDYALLSKKDGVWKIEQVLWQGPLGTIKR